MDMKRFVLSTIVVFVLMFAYEFLVHGVLLMDAYQATASTWRAEAEMQTLLYWGTISQLVLSAAITLLYFRSNPECSTQFGALVGVIIGITQFGLYPYISIPLSLAGLWFVAAAIEGIVIGFVLSKVSQPA